MAHSSQENHLALSVENIGLRLFKKRGLFGKNSFSHWALEDVSFEVERGQVFGVIGRNGAGKSSLLRVLARIFEPDRGRMRSFGLKTSLLGVKTGFLSELSGRDNTILSGMLLGKTRAEIIQIMPKIEEFAEIGHWMDRPVSTYSSGMAARLGFAIAINTNTDIIMIDEGLSVGDKNFKEKSRQKIEELMKSDKTIILVSHNAGTIESMTENAVWIEKGRSVLCGRSEMVAAAYDDFNRYLKEFKGDNNREEKALQAVLSDVHRLAPTTTTG